jgi:hypothetical protein
MMRNKKVNETGVGIPNDKPYDKSESSISSMDNGVLGTRNKD